MLIAYEDIINIEYRKEFMFDKIQIQGKKPEFNIILYLWSPKKLAELFQSKGVSVLGLT